MSGHAILVLGAGHVSAPLLEYLCKQENVQVTSVSGVESEIENVSIKFPKCKTILMDVVKQKDDLSVLIGGSNVVVSLLPISLHLLVLELCIKMKTHMVTASYTSGEMKLLEPQIRDAGITVVNEVGLDPGIDHFLAVRCFKEVGKKGGTVLSFESYCGGLPAPDAAENPLRYKFTWSPRDALLNITRPSKFIDEYKVVEVIPDPNGTSDETSTFEDLQGFELESYPNRDSTPYLDFYHLKNVKKFVRRTLRYRGHCQALKCLMKLGLLSGDEAEILGETSADITWEKYITYLVSESEQSLKEIDLEHQLVAKLGTFGYNLLKDLGLLEPTLVEKRKTPLDTISLFLARTLKFEKGERDLVILHHKIGIQWPQKKEIRNIKLILYGNREGTTAMAKTVGYTAAIATMMLLDGHPFGKGLVVPVDFSDVILRRLESVGICSETESIWI